MRVCSCMFACFCTCECDGCIWVECTYNICMYLHVLYVHAHIHI